MIEINTTNIMEKNGQCLYCDFFVNLGTGNVRNAFHTPNKRIDEWIYCEDFQQEDFATKTDRREALKSRTFTVELTDLIEQLEEDRHGQGVKSIQDILLLRLSQFRANCYSKIYGRN